MVPFISPVTTNTAPLGPMKAKRVQLHGQYQLYFLMFCGQSVRYHKHKDVTINSGRHPRAMAISWIVVKVFRTCLINNSSGRYPTTGTGHFSWQPMTQKKKNPPPLVLEIVSHSLCSSHSPVSFLSLPSAEITRLHQHIWLRNIY